MMFDVILAPMEALVFPRLFSPTCLLDIPFRGAEEATVIDLTTISHNPFLIQSPTPLTHKNILKCWFKLTLETLPFLIYPPFLPPATSPSIPSTEYPPFPRALYAEVIV